MIAHPPCTGLASSGRRWLIDPSKDRTLEEMWVEFHAAVAFYKIFRASSIPMKCIENPIMHDFAAKHLGPRTLVLNEQSEGANGHNVDIIIDRNAVKSDHGVYDERAKSNAEYQPYSHQGRWFGLQPFH